MATTAARTMAAAPMWGPTVLPALPAAPAAPVAAGGLAEAKLEITLARDEKLTELVYAGGAVADPVGAAVVAVPVGLVVVAVVVTTEEVVGLGVWAATVASRARVARRRKVVKDALAIMKGAREGM
ncbi:MAG: hypothetical protein BYD32DRAFT_411422 [Podila humilis]|nr:MAG: hypothetical protein BYD32DRAFT_411422 [Podila humilis]